MKKSVRSTITRTRVDTFFGSILGKAGINTRKRMKQRHATLDHPDRRCE